MLLSPDEKILYVALSNLDGWQKSQPRPGNAFAFLDTRCSRHQKLPGNYPIALAQSADGKRLFVADASSNAVCVFSMLIQA